MMSDALRDLQEVAAGESTAEGEHSCLAPVAVIVKNSSASRLRASCSCSCHSAKLVPFSMSRGGSASGATSAQHRGMMPWMELLESIGLEEGAKSDFESEVDSKLWKYVHQVKLR